MSDTKISPKLSVSQLKKHLLKWENIGRKWPGTQGEREAREYGYEEMKSNDGIDVELEEFEFSKWFPISTEVELRSPVKRDVKCAPVAYYANKEISGEIVYVGAGSKQDFEFLKENGVEFEDKIVMAINDAPFMVAPLVKDYSAAGLLTISDARMTGLQDLIRRCSGAFYNCTSTAEEMVESPEGFPVDITGAMLPMAEGHRILSLLSAGSVEVNIRNEADYSVNKTFNVIGKIEGNEYPEEKVVLGGHYDTQFTTPGVWDNGTGVASVLELARSISSSEFQPKRTMEFVLFGCEETGCFGSVNYVQNRREELADNCVGMFNLDTVSSTLTSKNTVWASEPMDDFVVETAEMLEWDIDIVDGVDLTFSDYAPFRDIGVQNTWIGDWGHIHPYYHAPQDTIEYVDAVELSRAVEVAGLCGTRLAGSDRRL